MSHDNENKNTKQAEEYYQMLASIGQEQWDIGKGGLQDVMSQLQKTWQDSPFLPENVRTAYEGLESGLQENFASSLAQQEGALQEKMLGSGADATMNPTAWMNILGQNRQSWAQQEMNAKNQLAMQQANAGLDMGMQIAGMLTNQGNIGAGQYSANLGGAAGGLMSWGNQQLQMPNTADQVMNYGTAIGSTVGALPDSWF